MSTSTDITWPIIADGIFYRTAEDFVHANADSYGGTVERVDGRFCFVRVCPRSGRRIPWVGCAADTEAAAWEAAAAAILATGDLAYDDASDQSLLALRKLIREAHTAGDQEEAALFSELLSILTMSGLKDQH